VSEGGGSFEVLVALLIRFEGWLFGGLIFDGPPAISLRPAFFAPGFIALLARSFIPEISCLSFLL